MGAEPQDERQQGMAGYGSFARVMDTLETSIPAEGYVEGPRFTAADLYLGAHIGWGLQWGTIEKRPGFEAYWARCSDRDAYRRAPELDDAARSDEHTSELQSLMRKSYAVFCLKKTNISTQQSRDTTTIGHTP